MRRIHLLLGAAVFGALVIGNGLHAQTTTTEETTTTTSTTGTVSDLTLGALIVQSPSETNPTSYSHSKSTSYVV